MSLFSIKIHKIRFAFDLSRVVFRVLSVAERSDDNCIGRDVFSFRKSFNSCSDSSLIFSGLTGFLK